jgi:hypothetical protein
MLSIWLSPRRRHARLWTQHIYKQHNILHPTSSRCPRTVELRGSNGSHSTFEEFSKLEESPAWVAAPTQGFMQPKLFGWQLISSRRNDSIETFMGCVYAELETHNAHVGREPIWIHCLSYLGASMSWDKNRSFPAPDSSSSPVTSGPNAATLCVRTPPALVLPIMR